LVFTNISVGIYEIILYHTNVYSNDDKNKQFILISGRLL